MIKCTSVPSKILGCSNFLQVFIRSLRCAFVFSHEKPYEQLRPLNKTTLNFPLTVSVVLEYIAEKTSIDDRCHTTIIKG